MSALEFSRGWVARCIRNAVSRREMHASVPPETRLSFCTARLGAPPRVPSSPGTLSRAPRAPPRSREIFFPRTLIFSRQKVARARIRSRRVLGLPRDFLLRQSVHVPFLNDLARALLNFSFVFHLFSTLFRNARRDVHVCLRYRHMQVSAALCRDTTFKFSKAATFRVPVRIYVCREKCSAHNPLLPSGKSL